MSALIFCGGNLAAEMLNADAFTDAYIIRLKQEDAAACIRRVQPLRLKVRLGGNDVHTVFLDHAYREYDRQPEALETILDRYVKATVEAPRESSGYTIDVHRIIPVVEDAAFASEIKASLKASGDGPPPSDIYHEPLNRELHVYYALDTDRAVRYLDRKEVESLGFGPDQLNARAVKNLTNLLPGIERRGDAGIYVVAAGGSYEASLLLFDTIWTKENFDVKGDIVVAVPSRNLLLVTGSEDESGLKTLRKLAEEAMLEEHDSLTAQLFVRRDGEWLPFDDSP
jgi:uncharacterized protein YtpQ (UPF0354 family)